MSQNVIIKEPEMLLYSEMRQEARQVERQGGREAEPREVKGGREGGKSGR